MSHETLLARKHEKVTAFLNAIFATATDYSRLLHCSETDAQKVLDAFQKVLDAQRFQDRKQMIAAMCRISKGTNLYPTQLFLKDPPEKLEVDPVDHGTFGEVYKITFEGRNMCFKAIKKHQKIAFEHMQKVYANEAISWAQLSHRNILPFYGLARIGSRLTFVSPWAANGNLVDYLSEHPGTNRLLLCKDTAAGMEYLHQNNIVHGDLKGLNVLIDSSGRAALSDFGLSSVTDPEILKWSTQSTMASKGGTVRWQAPELLLEQEDSSKEVYNTRESDMFAWASVCYEIFTGREPYHQISKLVSVALSIVQGKKPICPEDSDAAWHRHGLTRQMWDLMEECWAFQASERPTATAVMEKLQKNARPDMRAYGDWMDALAMRFRRGAGVGDVGDVSFWEDLDLLLTRVVSTNEETESRTQMLLAGKKEKVMLYLNAIFATTRDYRRLLHCSKSDAQKVLDAFQKVLDGQSFPDRKQMITAIRRISTATNLYPTQLFLRGPPNKLADEPEAYGDSGDIYKIPFEGKEVCFKVIRKYERSRVEDIAKVYAREAIPWAQLSHPNILPFIGLARIGPLLALVSPWAANGDLVGYLSQNPGANRLLLCADTVAGIEYLHQNNIVHGDLKGLNVLIDSSGRAALCGFGLSSVTHSQILEWSTQSTMTFKGGTVRWQAPKLLLNQEDPFMEVHNTKESDMFAWASVCYEIFTGRVPYYEIPNSMSVALSILHGKMPTCPEDNDAAWHKHGLTQQMWSSMEECWAFQASERPGASAVMTRLKGNVGPDTREASEWMGGLAMKLRKGQGEADIGDPGFWDDLYSLLVRVVPTN